MMRVPIAVLSSLLMLAGSAAAQPQLLLSSTVVASGQQVAATITGGPGQSFVLLGSAVNGGLRYAGVALGVGPDVTMLARGTLDGNGRAVVSVAPPFAGSVLDRYYLQAVTSTSPSFMPLEMSAVGVVRNADLVGNLVGPSGPPGPAGPQGPPGPTGPAGTVSANSVTGAHVADRTLTRLDLADASTLSSVENAIGRVDISINTIVAQLTVTAPAAGRVLVNASGALRFGDPLKTEGADCSLTTGLAAGPPYNALANEATANTYYGIPFGGTRVFDVAAGSSTTFRLICTAKGGNVVGAGDVSVFSPVLTALFVAGPS